MTARLPLEARPAVLDLIGNTPLLPVQRLDTGPCQLFLKLESQTRAAPSRTASAWP